MAFEIAALVLALPGALVALRQLVKHYKRAMTFRFA